MLAGASRGVCRLQLFSPRNSLQTSWRIFHTIITNSDLQQIYVVIDALDECEIDSVETLLVLLKPYIDTKEDDLGLSD